MITSGSSIIERVPGQKAGRGEDSYTTDDSKTGDAVHGNKHIKQRRAASDLSSGATRLEGRLAGTEQRGVNGNSGGSSATWPGRDTAAQQLAEGMPGGVKRKKNKKTRKKKKKVLAEEEKEEDSDTRDAEAETKMRH